MGLDQLFLGLTFLLAFVRCPKCQGQPRDRRTFRKLLRLITVKNWTHKKIQIAEQLKWPRAIQKCNNKDQISNTTSVIVLEDGCLANQSSRFYGCGNDEICNLYLRAKMMFAIHSKSYERHGKKKRRTIQSQAQQPLPLAIQVQFQWLWLWC